MIVRMTMSIGERALKMLSNYCITWGYIVEQMKTKYGYSPESTEQMSLGEIELYIDAIWEDFVEKKEREQ